ncbi:hypothetical protein WJX72_002469 [[Myrmecia] bisecta]|uniref:Survival protein SurE-like phosphatase/nucleotidase domain-containing protein n=1 Tax=[Myrmecia] bisecta TaxID=41462 RepID=A0AAW1QEE5_9CHLO
MPPAVCRPCVLVSNDDGVNAPGLRALVSALHEADCFDIVVLGPDRERSAQSHAISMGKPLTCTPINVEGVLEAFAVDGTPADSVMLALNSDVFKDKQIDLVVSGLNRGDNCGLHVIYSGTVGAAREATCKRVMAVAVSLDNHQARAVGDYQAAAVYTVAVLKAILGLLPGSTDIRQQLVGCTVNVNVPGGSHASIKGLHLTHQGTACVFPAFAEVYQQVAQVPVEDPPGSPSSAAQPILAQDPAAIKPGTTS